MAGSELHKGRFSQKKFKEDLLRENDDRFKFKEGAGIKSFKEKFNSVLNTHFDEKTFEKERKESLKHARSRFDKRSKPKKKLIGLFSEFALKLGYDESAREINTKIMRYVAMFCILLSVIVASLVFINGKSADVFVIFLICIWTIVYIAVYLLSALAVFSYMDIRMYQHVREIEEALPDFLQLASANISAGMTVDRALWFAVRSKFGILASEMEDIAKSTIVGEDLEQSLSRFGQKYDSRILKETMNLIVEGIQSGGEMAELLNKLSSNIKDNQLMHKEIGASVTTYAIFIGAATILAAPLLFALSTQLLTIIQSIFSGIQIDKSVGSSSLFSMNFSEESISLKDFRRFAILVLVISSFFSAAIIGVIRKGSVKDGLKSIPIFLIISLVLYFAASAMFASLMGGLF